MFLVWWYCFFKLKLNTFEYVYNELIHWEKEVVYELFVLDITMTNKVEVEFVL